MAFTPMRTDPDETLKCLVSRGCQPWKSPSEAVPGVPRCHDGVMSGDPTRTPPGAEPGMQPESQSESQPEIRPQIQPEVGTGGERRLVRRHRGSVVAGVATGLAEHLGIDVRIVRVVLVVLNLLFGIGLLAYGLLWALTPADAQTSTNPRRLPVQFLLVGAALVALGGLGVTGHRALPDMLRPALPILAVAVGAVIAWSDVDAFERHAWLGRATGRWMVPRLVAGAALAAVGFVVLFTSGQGLALAWDVTVATAAVLAGLGLVLTPWVAGFWRRYEREQAARIRETERADIAAHLHDSVLQTLALIQRTEDGAKAARLARAQERELRAWLYGGITEEADTLAAVAARVTHEAEDLHGVPVSLVVTGDRALDDDGEALVRALREALLNAVRHGAPPVSAYLEIGRDEAEAFVRDHGPGFDPQDVAPDRLGVRESIVGRMGRHGGSAVVRRLEEGTEVCLRMPFRGEPPERTEPSERTESTEPTEPTESTEPSESTEHPEPPQIFSPTSGPTGSPPSGLTATPTFSPTSSPPSTPTASSTMSPQEDRT